MGDCGICGDVRTADDDHLACDEAEARDWNASFGIYNEPPTMLHVVGLDLSLTSTGVAHSDGETERWRPKKLRGPARLEFLQSLLIDLLAAERPQLAVVEGYAYGAKGRAVFDIGELGGAVRLTLHHAGVPFVVVPPSVLKKFATGKGNADKQAVRLAAQQAAGHEFASHDESDAWWLRVIGLQLLDQPILAPRLWDDLAANVAWSDTADEFYASRLLD